MKAMKRMEPAHAGPKPPSEAVALEMENIPVAVNREDEMHERITLDPLDPECFFQEGKVVSLNDPHRDFLFGVTRQNGELYVFAYVEENECEWFYRLPKEQQKSMNLYRLTTKIAGWYFENGVLFMFTSPYPPNKIPFEDAEPHIQALAMKVWDLLPERPDGIDGRWPRLTLYFANFYSD